VGEPAVWTAARVVQELRSMADPSQLDGMARFGIRTDRALGGIGVPRMRALAKRVGHDHALAGELWATGIHEARLVATMVEEPPAVTEAQMESWVADVDSWDVCDQLCGNLFDRTPFAYRKAVDWSGREEEFVKRAAFALMAALAVHDKGAPDERFLAMLPLIEREAPDHRNFVRKAVNWALREIGKRNAALNAAAVTTARRILAEGPRSARWVASDAVRELTGEPVQRRLAERAGRSSPTSRGAAPAVC
jgi:3-methyladenine DNA glycosylase AlkD